MARSGRVVVGRAARIASAATLGALILALAGCQGSHSHTSVPATAASPPPELARYPDGSNTGVPAGTALKNVPCDGTSGPGWTYSGGVVSIRTANAVFSGYNLTGTVEVYAVGVVVK